MFTKCWFCSGENVAVFYMCNKIYTALSPHDFRSLMEHVSHLLPNVFEEILYRENMFSKIYLLQNVK